MKRNVKITAVLVIALVAMLALFKDKRPTHAKRSNVSASQQPPEPSAQAIDRVPPSQPQASAQQTEPAAGASVALKSYLMNHHPAAIESRLEQRDPFIGRYRLLGQRKVLLSSEESDELGAMLQDREKWMVYQEYLQRVDIAAHAQPDEQMYRLFLLQYLESSWNSQKDPETIEFLIDFVLQDNFGTQMATEIKKNLAYEKIKVLDFLRLHNPTALDRIKQKMPGLRHENLLRDYFAKPPAA